MAWKWTRPRRWYSATLANDTLTCLANARRVSPAWLARVRRRARVKRCHSAPACACHSTAPV